MLDDLIKGAAIVTSVVLCALALFLGLNVGTLAIHQEDTVRRAREDAECECYICDYYRLR